MALSETAHAAALSGGTRLGPYEVLGPLGAGGMGEVYKALDRRLDRTVAIKVLPRTHSLSVEARQRFEREARTISRLSHPHICSLYDLGSEGGIDYIVMEYLEGETLADRLAKGALSLDPTLRYAIEIADALEAAHHQGVVHRDLKPGNIMLTRAGVKLLDFGLARVISANGAESALSHVPTQDRPLTAEGTILGTLQYMAPEQLEGKETDARTDIFALGTVIHEMATGQKAFRATSQAALIGQVLHAEPPAISHLVPLSPPVLDRIVKTCLSKDPAERWQSAGDVGRQLRWIREESASGSHTPGHSQTGARGHLISWILLGALAAVIALGALIAIFRRQEPLAGGGPLTRFTIVPPPGGQAFREAVDLSPDGRRILFTFSGTAPALWLRPLDALSPVRLPGSDNAHEPFWSADGTEIAFFAEGKLKRMPAEGGPSRTVCAIGGYGVAGSWSRQGTILYSPQFGAGIMAVPADGGTPRAVTKLNKQAGDATHFFPVFLPDGQHFIFIARNLDPEKTEIRLGSLASPDTRPLFHADSAAVYADPGYLLFARDNAVFAWKFDTGRLTVVGEPVPLVEDVRYATENNQLVLSAGGNQIAYLLWSLKRRLVWVDRKGREVGSVGGIRSYEDVRISPDGRRVAASVRDAAHGQNLDVWVFDVGRGTGTRVTAERTDEFNPAWFPDGSRLAYVSDREGFYNLYARSASGGPATVLAQDQHDKILPSISPDGKSLLSLVLDKGGSFRSLLTLSSSAAGAGEPLSTVSQFYEGDPELSPDGRSSAFVSNESGAPEVYVQPLQDGGPKVQVSVGGGTTPIWRRDGREIFYIATDGKLMSVSLQWDGRVLAPDEPQPLFPLNTFATGPDPTQRPYDVSPDGERFLVIRRIPDAEPDNAVVVMNWTAALKR